jgi:hypothetical protein
MKESTIFVAALLLLPVPGVAIASDVNSVYSFELRARRDLYESLGFYEMDINGDGEITRDEFLAATDGSPEAFNGLDLDNNNIVTRDELEVAGLVEGIIGRVQN